MMSQKITEEIFQIKKEIYFMFLLYLIYLNEIIIIF